MPTITDLRAKLDLAAPAVHAATDRLWHAPGLAERYPRYLRAMHGVIRASVPLMELAARRCADRGDDDPVAGPLGRYLREHVKEEAEHDEWLLADLAVLGHDPDRTRDALPPTEIARLVGPQYYWIEHHHPVMLLGYIAVLEGNAPAGWLADRIVADTGVPAAAVRTVRAHAGLDTAHADEVFTLIDTLPLTTAQRAAVTISSLSTCDALLRVLDAITCESPGAARASKGEDRP
jgi:heme oxygenase-like protein